ncbi:ABC transporter permease [Chengkuizengella sediminis]|uniref:ABC transporter permease n=1 Tax=Chengkuizengella sediminis TaxID=1885917 RepID=UPI001389871E|nr:ABC transporter permease [Chengkuizengella sediminis]NDI35380.1 ABC transporter permease [Chengkuizengella sediminis]
MNPTSTFIVDTYLMTKRSTIAIFRNPFIFIPNIIISLFFLVVYQAGLSGISNIPAFDGASYLAFILPVSIVSGAIGGSGGAGQSLVRDLENGYFSRLLLTPTSRIAIVLGPIIAGMIQLFIQTVLILLVGLWMGLEIAAGFGGAIVVILLAAGFGLAFAGYSVAFALKTKDAQASQAGTFVFFPLVFLSTTFVPYELIEADWLKFVSKINPTTYIFDGMRSVLIEGWEAEPLLYAALVIVLICSITITFASLSAKKAVSRD